MKFINYLESIAGVGIFPLISLLVFFFFFVVLSIWAIKVSKEHLDEMSNIPLEKSTDSENN
jgi:cytochrome c oxidase cbb3-type subunit 3